ncbi:MAG: CCA tRNA nucleotidyltransferase [Candidatus Anstonellales archaeon]
MDIPQKTQKAMVICAYALSRIKPSHEENAATRKIVDEFYLVLRNVVPSDVDVELMGSVAKGTHLRGSTDLDFFLLFPKTYSKTQVKTLGLTYAKKASKNSKYEIRYAEHPYLRTYFHGYKIDIVPSYKIGRIREKGTSVDRSQLHTKYIKERLSDSQKDDVRLLKQFMKNLGIYGAELRVEGFSGYACELLILYYGTFMKLLESASKWDSPTIDIENYYGGRAREKFDSPIVIIDPVDMKRNVAAVISHTSLSRFILAARKFLKEPSSSFFFKEKVVHNRKHLRKLILDRKSRFLAIEFKAPNLVEDILWPQLRKTARAMLAFLHACDFIPLGHYFWSDGKKCMIFFEFLVYELPAIRKLYGPAVKFENDVSKFIEAHKNAINLHLEHERIVAIEKRKLTNAYLALKILLKNPSKHGIPKNFRPCLKKVRFLTLSDLLSDKYISVAGDYYTRKIE